MRNFLSNLRAKHFAKEAPTPHRELVEIESELKRKKQNPDLEAQKSFPWKALSYTKLNHSQRQIRLLKLETLYADENKNDRYIDCSLTTVSLDSEDVKYDALSYVWGDADVEKSFLIRINGAWSLITENLCIALLTLYHQGSTKGTYVWVDALCINQQDLNERSEQVGMMLDIFRRARVVHILLTVRGDIGSDGQPTMKVHPFDLLRELNEGALGANVYEMEQDVVDDLINFILRPWWKRLWVVQECIVAQQALAYIGKQVMPFNEIKGAIDRIVNASWAHEGPRKTETRHLWTSLIVESIIFDEVQDFDLPSQQVLSRFHTTNMKKSSDPKDRIYAQLGYLPAGINITPDYTMTVGEVYKSTTIRLMQWDDSLFPLYIIDFNRRKQFPSWVPDYDNIFIYQKNDKDACPSLPTFFQEHDQGELLVHALIADEVQAHALEPLKQLEGNDESFEATRAAVAECLAMARSVIGSRMDSDLTLRRSFWRTLCNGELEVLNPDHSTVTCDPYDFDTSELEAWLSGEKTEQRLVGMLHNVNRISATVNSQAFLVTAEKRFGNTHSFVSEGDAIALLAGSKLPMIVRPVDIDKEGYYKLVGPCYCDGIMNGEAIADRLGENVSASALDYGFEKIVLV